MLEQIASYFGVRRARRADEALARLAHCRRPGHCKYGHLMEGDNLYVSPKGQRMCRICNRRRDRKRRDRERRERLVKT